MQVSTDRWHYALYRFGSEFHEDKGCGQKANFCEYWRRATLGATWVATVLTLKWVGIAGICIFGLAIALVSNALANAVTIPFGVGVCYFEPGKSRFIIPFNFAIRGKVHNLGEIIIPLLILGLVGIGMWPGLEASTSPLISTLHGIGSIVAIPVSFIICLFASLACTAKIVDAWKWVKNKKMADGPVADAWQHAKAYYKAKKERLCPMIEFVDPPLQ